MLLDRGLRCISFSHAREALMNHRREPEDRRAIDTLSFPSQDGLLGLLQGASGGMEAPPLGAGLDPVPEHADRGFDPFQEGLCCLGERGRTVLTLVHDTATTMLCGRERMIWNLRRVTCRALESSQFHVIDLLSGLMRSMTDGRHNLICPGIPITERSPSD